MKDELEDLKDGKLRYYPEFLSKPEADRLFELLLKSDSWKQEPIKIFGKEMMQPRLTALFGMKNKTYTYSGLKMQPLPFPNFLSNLKEKCVQVCGTDFNICLANLYRDGQDSMGWHADNEKELGHKPLIASISLGEERMFHLKHMQDKTLKYKKRLQHGSLLIMEGSTQEFWKHQLPKTQRPVEPRINLTFRKIY